MEVRFSEIRESARANQSIHSPRSNLADTVTTREIKNEKVTEENEKVAYPAPSITESYFCYDDNFSRSFEIQQSTAASQYPQSPSQDDHSAYGLVPVVVSQLYRVIYVPIVANVQLGYDETENIWQSDSLYR